jgi:hypothetical protein
MEKRGFEENVSVSEGLDPVTGIETILHFEGDEFITEKKWDAAPHLAHAAHARQSTAGQSWGTGKFVGHIPPVFYAQIMVIKDKEERRRAVKRFFEDNPAFVMFDKYLK